MKFKSQQPASFHDPKCKSKGKSCSRKYQNDGYNNLEHESSKKVPSILFKRAYTGKTGYVEIVEIKEKKKQNHHAIACPGKVLIEKRKQDSVYKRSSGYTDVNGTRPESSEASDSSKDECSVGSCSLNSWRQDGFFESELLYSDAESVYPSCDKEEEDRDDCLKEKVEVSVHSLELHAYRCTLEALFVSGPLSWEQEELLTNLRITLHISNDEHLKLLRDLISSATSK